MFSIVTIAWSTRMPTESARPPSVIRFSVSPSMNRTRIEARIESGIVRAMISVERQLPRKQQHHRRGQPGGEQRLEDHALHRRLDEHRLVEQRRAA